MVYSQQGIFKDTKSLGKIFAAGAAAVTLSIAMFASAFAVTPPTVQLGVWDGGGICPGVTSEWDNSTGNPAPSIKLSKPCATSTMVAPYADVISSYEGQAVSNLTSLSFDYKTSEYCGAGSPRFSLDLYDSSANYIGSAYLSCFYGTTSVADPATGYTTVTFDSATIQAWVTSAGGYNASIVGDIYVILDEQGTVHVDNITVNGVVATPALSKEACKNNGWKTAETSDGKKFKNQGQCVAYVQSSANSKHHRPVVE